MAPRTIKSDDDGLCQSLNDMIVEEDNRYNNKVYTSNCSDFFCKRCRTKFICTSRPCNWFRNWSIWTDQHTGQKLNWQCLHFSDFSDFPSASIDDSPEDDPLLVVNRTSHLLHRRPLATAFSVVKESCNYIVKTRSYDGFVLIRGNITELHNQLTGRVIERWSSALLGCRISNKVSTWRLVGRSLKFLTGATVLHVVHS